jgi:hypothetical protein
MLQNDRRPDRSPDRPRRTSLSGPASLDKSTLSLLAKLAGKGAPAGGKVKSTGAAKSNEAQALIAADLAVRGRDGRLAITDAGRAHLARLEFVRNGSPVDPFLGQHLGLARAEIETADGRAAVIVDTAESPLAWLARRKGRDGRALIEPVQFQAGEQLRADFTRARLMPRITANWTSSVAQNRRGGGGPAHFTDTVIDAHGRVCRALDQVGHELAGLLLDVCCFLKRLEDVERERGWPPRSAKVVLQLGLDRLARHYGLAAEARGAANPQLRTWLAEDASFTVGE